FPAKILWWEGQNIVLDREKLQAKKMPDRIYKLASAILASGNNIRPQAAITIAMWFVQLMVEIEGFKNETAAVRTIIDAIKDKWLFGSLFPDLTSWSSWVVFLKAVFGIEMDAKELELYRACTKRSEPPKFGAKESYAIVGPRGGKSGIVSFAAVYIATFFDFKKYLAPGETGMVLILARDRDQAKVVFNYIGGIIKHVPPLNQMAVNWRSEEIELSN